MASSGKVREAYDRYVHPDFFHHNPYFKGDRESLLAGMEESAVEFPDKAFEAVRVLEDGEFVVVHGRIRLKPDTRVCPDTHLPIRRRSDHRGMGGGTGDTEGISEQEWGVLSARSPQPLFLF